MINFDELRIASEEVLDKEKWNGLLDDTARFFDTEGDIHLGDLKLSLGDKMADTKLAIFEDETNTYGFGIKPNQFVFNIGNTSARYSFFNKFSGSGRKEVFTIEGSGNVGVGTTSPASKLDVRGEVRANKLVITPDNTLPSSSTDKITIERNSTNKMEIQTSGDSHLHINPDGNHVYIGKGNESELALDIKGQLNIHGESPIQIHRITGLQSGENKQIIYKNKPFSDSKYNACVVGYRSSSQSANITMVRVKRISGNYYIESRFSGGGTIDVDVMVTRYGISFATGI